MEEQLDLLQQLKRIIENDKVFIGPEFLSYFARIVFGKKPDASVAKNASILAKEFKALLQSIEKKQKDSKVTIISFNEYENEIYKLICKTFTLNQKIVDGDVCLDKFKSFLPSHELLSLEKATEYINKYVYQEVLSKEQVSILEARYIERKALYNAIGQYQALSNFIQDGYKDVTTFAEFLDNFNNVLQNALMETKAYSSQNEHTVAMSNEEIQDILAKELRRERISTRYKLLDKILNGGFENGRVYMFGGVSGGGKSLVLVNLAYMSLRSLQDSLRNKKKDEKTKKAVLYLSLENSIDETKMRFVCCALGLRKQQIDEAILFNKVHEYEEKFNACFKDENTELFIMWQPPKSMNTLDLMTLINDIERRNDVKVDIVYVDYADKLNAINPSKADQEWRDLGAITDELKTLAVDYNIPVITVTQLTTSSYKKDAQLDGSAVSGSRRKFENTDFLAIFDFVSRDMRVIDNDEVFLETMSSVSNFEDWIEVWCTVDKNRDGPSNVKFKTYIDYSSYRLVDNLNNISTIFGTTISNASSIETPASFMDTDQNNISRYL